MNGVLEGFLVIGIVVAVGYGVGRAGVLGPHATRVLSRTAFFVATPALLFTTLARTDISAVFSANLLVTAVTSSLACLLYVPFGLLRRRPPGEVAVGAMASGYVNAGNLGLPIAVYVLGDAAAVAPILLFQLAVLTPVFTTLLDVLPEREERQRNEHGYCSGGERPSWVRVVMAPLRNPIAIATAAGLVVSGTGLPIPEAVGAPLSLIADLAVPCMLLAFGISLNGAARPGAGEIRGPLWTVVALKNVVHPALAWLVAGPILGLSGTALLAAVVCAALPTAQNVFGYAVRYDRGVTLARDAALTTTIVAVPAMIGVVALVA